MYSIRSFMRNHLFLFLFVFVPFLFSCSRTEPQVTVYGTGDNDYLSLIKKGGIPYSLCSSVREAIETAPEKTGVMLLYEGPSDSGNVLTEEDLKRIKEKSLRVFVECPIIYGKYASDLKDTLKLERIVVKDSLCADLPALSLMSFNNAIIKGIPVKADSVLLVAAKVAGFDTAFYGLENTPSSPVLFFTEDGILMATTRISQFAHQRFMPSARIKALLEHIYGYVSGSDVEFDDFHLLVNPAYSRTAPLKKNARAESVKRGIEWYYNGHFLVDASWKDEYVGRYMGDGTMPVGPEVPAGFANGDGSLGVLEGHMSSINSDGSQKYRYWMRADVQGESAYAFASASSLLGNREYARVSDNLLNYSFNEYRDGVRNDPASPTYGLIGWAYTHKGTYYGDDNARYLLGALGATAYLGTDKYDRKIIEGILGNFRTSGTNGFRGGSLLDVDIQRRGWQDYYHSPTVNLHPHVESWLWACYLWLYAQSGEKELLERVERGVSMMIAGYPDNWSWTNGIQQERARMILPLAWLYRVSPTPEHKQWLDYMAGELLKNQVECGGIREELGNPSKSSFGKTPSNEAYGITEAPLIFDNGDPVADMLYTTNFAFVGLCEAAAATGDAKYIQSVNKMSDFLTRIQVRSDQFKSVDGAWFRAFDYDAWDYWASNADAGWGAWSTLTGWIQSWIVGTQALLEKNTSLWELANSKQLPEGLVDDIWSEMIGND